MCSVETYSSLSARISPSASRSTRTSSLDGPAASPPWLTVGSASRAALASERTVPSSAPRLVRPGAELRQEGRDHAGVLLQQDDEQVLGRPLRIAPTLGQRAGRGHGLLGLDG